MGVVGRRDYNTTGRDKLILSGQCRACGQPVSEKQLWFDKRTGVALFNGRDVQFTPSQAVVFDLLLKKYPEPVSFLKIQDTINAGRVEGGAAKQTVAVMLCNFRKRLKELGFVLLKPSNSDYILAVV